MSTPKFSVVSTLFKSSKHIIEFIDTVNEVMQGFNADYELILVDDGSPDDSYDKCKKLGRPNLKLIKFSRNFGHHRAIYAGLEHAKGEIIFLIDSDLEENPKDFSKLFREIEADENLFCVYGINNSKKSKIYEFFSKKYYQLFNILSEKALQERNLMTLRIMKKEFVDAFLKHKDKNLILAPVMSLSGYSIKGINLNKQSSKGSTYSIFDRYNIFINGILSFSSKPLYFVFYSGISITFLSFFFLLYTLFLKVFGEVSIDGWTSLIISIWLIGGIISTFLGIISIYINYIFLEVKDRPLYIVQESYGFEDEESSDL